MHNIAYKFAYDENKVIVCIDSLTERHRAVHRYYCINCGAEMIVKLGKKRAHHFAHKHEVDSCSQETYLHKLTKLVIKDKFDSSAEFLIEYQRKYSCDNKNVCPFYDDNCFEEKLDKFDLRKYYDTCEEEQTICGFVADLLITNSKMPDRAPILIEILVSHKCSQEKLDSGLRIIEIPIKDENDIITIRSGKIKEADESLNKNSKHVPGRAKFINFEKNSKKVMTMAKKSLHRLIVYKSGSIYVEYNQIHPNCREQHIRRRYNSMLELNIDPDNFLASYELGGLVIAMNLGCQINNCSLCKHHRPRYDDYDINESPIFCSMSKNYGTPRYPKKKEANNCQYYSVNKKMLADCQSALKNCKYSIV